MQHWNRMFLLVAAVFAGSLGCAATAERAARGPVAAAQSSAARPDVVDESPAASIAERPASHVAESSGPSPTRPAADATADFEKLTADLEGLGAIDPAARARIIEDMRRTDPALWPLLVQYFRASLAHQQQAAEVSAAGHPGAAGSTAGSGEASDGRTSRSGEPGYRSPAIATAPATGPASASMPLMSPATDPAAELDPPAARPSSPANDGQVIQATYTAPSADGDWHVQLDQAIAALDAELASAGPAADETRQARQRLLCLAGGRRDEALRPLPGLPAGQQDYWSQQLFALDLYLDAQRSPDAGRRAAEAAQHLQAAAASLGETGALVVHNLAFCTEVKGYGVYSRFERDEFRPGQEVLLYAEVENLKSESTPKGYHTALQTHYRIFDPQGRQVDEQEFSLTEEYCQNRRRDFFILFDPLHISERMYDGKYSLQLSVEDTLNHKIGQSTIEFTVRQK